MVGDNICQVRDAIALVLPHRYYTVQSITGLSLHQIEGLLFEQVEVLTDLCYTLPQTSYPSERYDIKVLRIQKLRYRKTSKVNIYPKSGPARGLIRIIRKFYSFERLAKEKYAPNSGRDLIKYEVQKDMPGGRFQGVYAGGKCRWCGQPTKTLRHQWHKDCVAWFLAARGLVKPPEGRVHKGPHWQHTRWEEWTDWNGKKRRRKVTLCCECKTEPYTEVDHIRALSIAWELRKRGDRRWWRAWTPGNLRPLCHDCHNLKTRTDRRELSRLQKGQLELL